MELNGSRVLREANGVIQRRCCTCNKWKTSDFFCPSNWNNGGNCRSCNNKRNKEWRINNSEQYRNENSLYQKAYYKNNKDKILKKKRNYIENNQIVIHAAAILNNAVSRGKIVRPDKCSICGCSNRKIMGHHDDYSKPLKVRWVCQSCHQYIHERQYDLKEEGKHIVPKPRGPQISHLREARKLLGEVVACMGVCGSYLEIQKFLQDSCGKGCQKIFVPGSETISILPVRGD